jgi:hypothetical protein
MVQLNVREAGAKRQVAAVVAWNAGFAELECSVVNTVGAILQRPAGGVCAALAIGMRLPPRMDRKTNRLEKNVTCEEQRRL